MAKVKPSLIKYSGTVGREIHYTRFGRTYSRQLPAEYNDRKSEAQMRQRALFKARQKTSALFGTILQRGLTKEAHSNGMTEANYFSRLNKDHFVYDNGEVHINYPALLVAQGPLPVVDFMRCHADGLHVDLAFRPCLEADKSRPDDVVHIYAVEPNVEICQLMASILRQDGQASFNLPDLSDEVTSAPPSPTISTPSSNPPPPPPSPPSPLPKSRPTSSTATSTEECRGQFLWASWQWEIIRFRQFRK